MQVIMLVFIFLVVLFDAVIYVPRSYRGQRLFPFDQMPFCHVLWAPVACGIQPVTLPEFRVEGSA
jgi:hypothetical protein